MFGLRYLEDLHTGQFSSGERCISLTERDWRTEIAYRHLEGVEWSSLLRRRKVEVEARGLYAVGASRAFDGEVSTTII
jgi:hypothetical protein